ncbi:MAG: beta strand repeat-containing protein, partial [Chthoniobacterales bacterium]
MNSHRPIRSLCLSLTLVLVVFTAAIAPASAQTYFNMSSGNYSESFTGWTNYPVNWNGLATNSTTNAIPSATRITTTSVSIINLSSSGGVQSPTNGSGVNIQFLSTGGTDNTASVGTDLNLNFSNRVAGTLGFDAAAVANSTGNRVGTLRVYFATNSSPTNASDWTEITGGGLPYVATNNVAGSTAVSAALPAAISSNNTVKLRFYYANGTGGTTGSRPRISIDNLQVTSTSASANAPTVTSFSPSGGPAGTSVVITGANFSTATTVAFNGATASFTIDNSTQITATVPGAATTGLISVTNPGGTGFSASSFTVPSVTVSFSSGSINEGATGTGFVTLSELATSNVVVNLASSSPADLVVPATATVPDGELFTSFIVSAPADSTVDSNTNVTVTPTASGFAPVPGIITVINTDAVKIPLSSLGTNSYTQDFNTLGTNAFSNVISTTIGVQASLGGVVNTNLNGWFATAIAGSSVNTNLAADNGSSTNEAVYNYGTTGDANRSLGSLAGGSMTPAFGALISNSTVSTLNSVVVNLTGKIWRSSTSAQNFLNFAYGKVDGTVVNNINFLTATNPANVFALPLANIYGPSPVATNGPLDGNNVTNQVQISNVTIPVALAPGETMFIRWQDFNNPGNDAGLAIDDVSLTASTALAGPVLGAVVVDDLLLLQNGATVSSSVLTDAGSALTSRGFVYSQTSLNSNPVVGGPNATAITNAPPDVSAFTNAISGLLASTAYTVKSFAINANGTNYGPAATFNTLAPSPSFTGVYTQSFDGLTNTTLPSGWRAISTGGINGYSGSWTNSSASTGGFYGRTNTPGILGYLHTGNSGILTNRLTLINNTGGTLTNLFVSYMGEVNLTNNTRFPAWTVVVDGKTNASLAYSTAGGSNEFKSAQITGLNISNGGTITIGWWSDRGTNTNGSSRLIGMTSVRVATNAIGVPTI